jgi:peptide chain release factor 2
MNDELKDRLKGVKKRLEHMWSYLDLEKKEREVVRLDEVMAEGDFWNDGDRAQKVIAEANGYKVWTVPYAEYTGKFADVEALIAEAYELGDEEMIEELLDQLCEVEAGIEKLEVQKMLSGELDGKSCYLTINAGAGGTEACDWVEMLARMYERWASRRRWKIKVIDRVDGEVAGAKSVTFEIEGSHAYGYSKAEKGVHRLVRISPFDSNSKRHTSFASVDVSPEIEDEIEVNIRTEDVRVDTFRASGAGGQHVNTTDSAVRMTHVPSGIVVTCQNERSQIQNRETCMKMLRAKLYEKEVLEREEALKRESGEKMDIAWGSQIRNYVFQPYTLVKDTRTKYEEGNIQDVMDGNLDPFIIAYLKEFG